MKAQILGSGTSSGVPRIGRDWGECDPAEPRNRRTRASLLIEHDGTRILVDTSPDMREQLLAADISVIDAVIWTHDHADHCHGIDDLRQIYHSLGHPVRALARQPTLDAIRTRFAYAFAGRGGYPATVSGEILPDSIVIGSITVDVVDQPHGSIHSAGLRFQAAGVTIGYATDFSEMTSEMAVFYQNLDLWIADALRRRPHPTHANLSTVLHWIDILKPARSALIHMDQTMDYRTLAAELPPGVQPGYDGLEFLL